MQCCWREIPVKDVLSFPLKKKQTTSTGIIGYIQYTNDAYCTICCLTVQYKYKINLKGVNTRVRHRRPETALA